MADMRLVIGGQLIPKPSTFVRIESPNAIDVRTLGNVLYTDFINRSRSWQIGWKNILEETDLQIIKDLVSDQFQTGVYPMMQFDQYDLYCQVKIDISQEKIKYNGVLVENFTMTLTEKDPITFVL